MSTADCLHPFWETAIAQSWMRKRRTQPMHAHTHGISKSNKSLFKSVFLGSFSVRATLHGHFFPRFRLNECSFISLHVAIGARLSGVLCRWFSQLNWSGWNRHVAAHMHISMSSFFMPEHRCTLHCIEFTFYFFLLEHCYCASKRFKWNARKSVVGKCSFFSNQ